MLSPVAAMRPSAASVLRHSLIAAASLQHPVSPQSHASSPLNAASPGSPMALYRQAVQHEHAQLTAQCEAARQRTSANAAELKRLQSLRDFFESALQLSPGEGGL